MSRDIDDDSDQYIADISALTANMSIDESVDRYDTLAMDSLIEPASPPQTFESEFPPSLSTRASPNPPLLLSHESKLLPPSTATDIDIQKFIEQADRLLPMETLPGKQKFAVILSPHGYKHVFSRHWVSKKQMASVVERPERLKACCLGIGLARTEVPFKLLKSSRRSSLHAPHVEAVHNKDWAIEIYALCSKAATKLSKGELEVPDSWPYYDIYLSPNTAEALEGNVAAIELGVDEIFQGCDDIRRAFITVRPPGHHCHEDEASGFCIINNAHIAIQYAKMSYGVTHAVILDFDLHHGDGSQDLLWKLGFDGEGNTEIPMGYFSIHDINSFPCEAGFASPKKLSDASVCFVAHKSAVWNIHFEPYETEEEFDTIYASRYSVLFQKAAQFLEQSRIQADKEKKPFLPLVVISAGFDGSEFETPGMQRHQVHVPTSFYNRFTRDSVALAENFGNGHIISLLEGGYSSAAVATGVFSHLTGLGEKPYDTTWCPPETTPHEIDVGMRQRWRLHPEKWTGKGLSIGRTLLPPFSSPQYSTTTLTSASSVERDSKERHNLRRKVVIHSS